MSATLNTSGLRQWYLCDDLSQSFRRLLLRHKAAFVATLCLEILIGRISGKCWAYIQIAALASKQYVCESFLEFRFEYGQYGEAVGLSFRIKSQNSLPHLLFFLLMRKLQHILSSAHSLRTRHPQWQTHPLNIVESSNYPLHLLFLPSCRHFLRRQHNRWPAAMSTVRNYRKVLLCQETDRYAWVAGCLVSTSMSPSLPTCTTTITEDA